MDAPHLQHLGIGGKVSCRARFEKPDVEIGQAPRRSGQRDRSMHQIEIEERLMHTYEPPCHGPHRETNRVCPGCLKADYERQLRQVPAEVLAAVERQDHLRGLRAIAASK